MIFVSRCFDLVKGMFIVSLLVFGSSQNSFAYGKYGTVNSEIESFEVQNDHDKKSNIIVNGTFTDAKIYPETVILYDNNQNISFDYSCSKQGCCSNYLGQLTGPLYVSVTLESNRNFKLTIPANSSVFHGAVNGLQFDTKRRGKIELIEEKLLQAGPKEKL